MRAALLFLGIAVCACGPLDAVRPSGDAANGDTPAVGPPPDVPCHVDCFGGMTCMGGTAKRSTWGGRDCCSSTTCGTPWLLDVCTISRVECPSRACDDRRLRCNSANLHALSRPDLAFDVSLLCAGGGHREGDRCVRDADCAPQVEGLSGRLRCATNTCVRGARPSTATGAPCVWDDDCAEGDRCDCGGGAGTARVCVRDAQADAGPGDGGDAAGGG